MDRLLIYAGEVPRSADILGGAKSALYGLGHLVLAAIGPGPAVSGLALAATGPASLNLTVGRGSIYTDLQVDPNPYGVLGTDTNDIGKQGILPSPTTITITPPGTSGYSQVYLVQAIYNDVDGGATTLPYYNSTNPSVPLSGPANSGTPQFTARQGVCAIALKAGIAAPTGSQVAPTPDAGYTGLYYITVANGQTSITSANWITYPGAPFIPNLMSLDSRYQRRLIGANTFYVNGTFGDDSNPGSSAQPFLTMQGAVDSISSTYLSTSIITVNASDNTYGGFTVSPGTIANWNFVGNSGTPANVVIAEPSSVTNGGNSVNVNGATVTMTGFTFTSSNSNLSGVAGNVHLVNCNFTGSSSAPSIGVSNGSVCTLNGAIGYSGNGVAIAQAQDFSKIVFATTTTTLTIAGTPTFSTASVISFDASVTFNPGNLTITGSASGPRYAVSANGVVNTSGSGATYLPGSTSGAAATGGQYI